MDTQTERFRQLQDLIDAAFPDVVVEGPITEADDEPWREELDDDLDLARELRGKSWKSVAPDFIDRHANDLPLLTPTSFATFLPAWILRGVSSGGSQRNVLQYTVYCLSPRERIDDKDAVSNAMESWRRNRMRIFTRPQLAALIAFLEFVANDGSLRWLQDDALRGRQSLNSL